MQSADNFFVFVMFVAVFLCLCIGLTKEEEIRIDLENIAHVTDDKFVGVTIDSGILRRHWAHFDPKSEKLQTLASALSPCYLRVGGNDADFLTFSENSTTPDPVSRRGPTRPAQDLSDSDNRLKWNRWEQNAGLPDMKMNKNRDVEEFEVAYSQSQQMRRFGQGIVTNFTMSAEIYDQLHQFVSKVDWSLIFDLNVLLRKEGSWDPANAVQLMDYTVKKGYQMAGWELGNEPNIIDHLIKFHIEPEQLAHDYREFKSVLATFAQFQNALTVGPSVTQLEGQGTINYYKRFLKSGGADVVTAATFHQYYMDSAVATVEKFTDPNILNVLIKEVEYGVNLTHDSGSKAKVWLGETSTSWGGGAVGLSDSYVAAFMWLDKLGICAAGGVDVVIRQSFYGYNYSLVDNNNFNPHPDYWLTLLYKLLVGNRVLKVVSPSKTGRLRAYAHCAATKKSGYKAGSVVVYVLNLHKEDQNLTFPDFVDSAPLHVYNMEPEGGNLKSKTVLLNGQPLQMVNNATLPSLLRPVRRQAPVTIKSLTYSFIVFPEAQAKDCL